MMAHEIPLPIHQTQYKDPPESTQRSSAAKVPKNVKLEQERELRNGESVDFDKGPSKPKPVTSKRQAKKSKGDTPSGATTLSSNKKKNGSTRSDSPALPNGEKPNFYNNESTKSKETPKNGSKKKGITSKVNSLPDGAGPNFETGRPNRKKSTNDQTLPNGEKPNFTTNKAIAPKKSKGSCTTSQPKDKKPAALETYAGSSFHSSPAALNLPKPTFKTSPKEVIPAAVDDSVESNGSSSRTISSASSPSSQVMHPPPQHPVTAYPPGSVLQPNGPGQLLYQQQHPVPPNQFIQPGFAYNYSPQGYIHYQYPVGVLTQFAHMQPPHGYPNSAPIVTHYQQPAPGPLPIQGHPNSYNSQNQSANPTPGQKITFDDLLGSTKG